MAYDQIMWYGSLEEVITMMKRISNGKILILLLVMCLGGCANNVTSGSSQDTKTSITTESEDKMDKLNSNEVHKISAYVLGKECFSSKEEQLHDIKGMLSRLSENNMSELPKAEDGLSYEGGCTQLNVYTDGELQYSLELIETEEYTVVRIEKEGTSFYYDISADDQKLFHDIYNGIYEENAS